MMINIRYHYDKIFTLGVALITQGVIISTIAPLITLTLKTLLTLVMSMLSIAIGFSFILYEFSTYIRERITIKGPMEPLLLSTMIVAPLYLGVCYWLIKTVSSKLFAQITALELYIISAMLPTIGLLLAIYILSS